MDHQQRRTELREDFATYASTRDGGTRRRLIEAHLGLAEHLARRFVHRGEAYDDLVQVSSLALVKAVDRFDPERGVEFTTFATRTIIGELKRHFRDRGWAVRAPRRIQELYLHIGQVIAILSQENGRSPVIKEIAIATGATEDDVIEALEAGQGYRSASLDAPGPDGETRRSQTPSTVRHYHRTSPSSPNASVRSSSCASWRASPSPRSPIGWGSARCTSHACSAAA
jgi:RNA polymerase sigma-B factor